MAISAPYLLPVSTSSSGTGVATGTGASTTNRKASTGSACDYTDRSTLRLYPIDFVANQQMSGTVRGYTAARLGTDPGYATTRLDTDLGYAATRPRAKRLRILRLKESLARTRCLILTEDPRSDTDKGVHFLYLIAEFVSAGTTAGSVRSQQKTEGPRPLPHHYAGSGTDVAYAATSPTAGSGRRRANSRRLGSKRRKDGPKAKSQTWRPGCPRCGVR
eukprot:3654975-Rhodomonas_salina.2